METMTPLDGPQDETFNPYESSQGNWKLLTFCFCPIGCNHVVKQSSFREILSHSLWTSPYFNLTLPTLNWPDCVTSYVWWWRDTN